MYTKIKVSHESPLQLMPKSRNYNDYDYALVHLFETHPAYYEFFKESLKLGREVLLDNSIFELGTAFDSTKFYNYVVDLQPSYYVVPDVLEDCKGTINSFQRWLGNHNFEPIKHIPKIGVIQGKTFEELVECYKFMSHYADYIAISFDYSYYQISALGSTKLERMCNGRIKLIDDFVKEGVWNYDKPHHLLGCSLPNEFKHYTEKFLYNSIRSIDTSNPVVAGLHNIRYIDGVGLVDKLSIKLCDLIDYLPTDVNETNVMYNVSQFRTINNL